MLWNSLNQTVELGWDFYLPVILFVGLIALLNGLVAAAGGLVGMPGASIEGGLGFVLAPLAWLLGVPWDQATLVGGAIGTLAGIGTVSLVAAVTPLPATIGATMVVVTVGLSGSIGLFFGVVPARRAAKLDPIVALRSL